MKKTSIAASEMAKARWKGVPAEERAKLMSEAGKKGGAARASKLSKKRLKEIARTGGLARAGNAKEAG